MTKFLHASKLANVGFFLSFVCLLLLGRVIDPLLILVLGTTSFAIALYCMIKYKENSYAVWLSLIIGFFGLFLI